MNSITPPSIDDERTFWKQVYLSIIPLTEYGSVDSADHADQAVAFYRKFCQKQDQQRRKAHADKLL